jgi:hypothetical protein
MVRLAAGIGTNTDMMVTLALVTLSGSKLSLVHLVTNGSKWWYNTRGHCQFYRVTIGLGIGLASAKIVSLSAPNMVNLFFFADTSLIPMVRLAAGIGTNTDMMVTLALVTLRGSKLSLGHSVANGSKWWYYTMGHCQCHQVTIGIGSTSAKIVLLSAPNVANPLWSFVILFLFLADTSLIPMVRLASGTGTNTDIMVRLALVTWCIGSPMPCSKLGTTISAFANFKILNYWISQG